MTRLFKPITPSTQLSNGGSKICCPEEISFKQGWIDVAALRKAGQSMKNEYGAYLLKLVDGLINGVRNCVSKCTISNLNLFDDEDFFESFNQNNK